MVHAMLNWRFRIPSPSTEDITEYLLPWKCVVMNSPRKYDIQHTSEKRAVCLCIGSLSPLSRGYLSLLSHHRRKTTIETCAGCHPYVVPSSNCFHTPPGLTTLEATAEVGFQHFRGEILEPRTIIQLFYYYFPKPPWAGLEPAFTRG